MQLTDMLGVSPTRFLLPKTDSLEKWSVVACDQHTSEPEYWDVLEKLIKDEPSALRMILPEYRLGSPDVDGLIASANAHMDEYLANGVFRETETGFVFVERTTDAGTRKGLLCAIDLEKYSPDGSGVIKPTEGTVPERIPPRVMVRKDASLELTHVLMLMDDLCGLVVNALEGLTDLPLLYDSKLNMGGGHIKGSLVSGKNIDVVANAMLDAMERAKAKNGENAPFIVVGDGNHSLAAAKAHWETLKQNGANMDHPARFASVEIVNIHDPAVLFEPIHRVVSNVDADIFVKRFCEIAGELGSPITDPAGADAVSAEFVAEGRSETLFFKGSNGRWAIHVVQGVLDMLASEFPQGAIDYVHGNDVAKELGCRQNSIAILLPAIDKNSFFRAVASEGRMPRKTFSIGEATDKRYYTEARKIIL